MRRRRWRPSAGRPTDGLAVAVDSMRLDSLRASAVWLDLQFQSRAVGLPRHGLGCRLRRFDALQGRAARRSCVPLQPPSFRNA